MDKQRQQFDNEIESARQEMESWMYTVLKDNTAENREKYAVAIKKFDEATVRRYLYATQGVISNNERQQDKGISQGH